MGGRLRAMFVQRCSVGAQDLLYGPDVPVMGAQYFDAAQPKKEDKPEAAAGADLGSLIAAEVQDLKKDEGRLFSYVKTNVNGLLYLHMKRDVGALWHNFSPWPAEQHAIRSLMASCIFQRDRVLPSSCWRWQGILSALANANPGRSRHEPATTTPAHAFCRQQR